MKINKLIGLMALMGFCACAETEHPENKPEYISFSPTVTGSRATDTNFDENDRIGVFAMIDNGVNEPGGIGDNPYAKNVPYAFSGGKFTAMSQGIELNDNTGKMFYFAVYPYNSNLTDKYAFECRKDQSEYSGYTQSDLMVAYTDESTAEQQVELKFMHILSKAIINLKYTGLEVYSVTLNNVNYSVELDLKEGIFSSMDDKADVKMNFNGNKSYKAVITPQVFMKDEKFATIETSVGTYSVRAANDIVLKAGMLKDIYVELNATKGLNEMVCIAYTK